LGQLLSQVVLVLLTGNDTLEIVTALSPHAVLECSDCQSTRTSENCVTSSRSMGALRTFKLSTMHRLAAHGASVSYTTSRRTTPTRLRRRPTDSRSTAARSASTSRSPRGRIRPHLVSTWAAQHGVRRGPAVNVQVAMAEGTIVEVEADGIPDLLHRTGIVEAVTAIATARGRTRRGGTTRMEQGRCPSAGSRQNTDLPHHRNDSESQKTTKKLFKCTGHYYL